jgi:hypothetical protein
MCRPGCTSNADCAPDLCVIDPFGGTGVCARSEVGLCTNTCIYANDTECDDGGDASAITQLCTLGTDCNDCGARTGGNQYCDDSCDSVNGVCEDGGTGSNGAACFWGQDCSDCGPRSTLCSDSCRWANDGACDYNGPCAVGTDCTDCGIWAGGKGENPCDGTTQSTCTHWGAERDTPGSCQCDDCAWDQADCGSPNLCNGSSISACCGATNSCGFVSDDYCDCGGWCAWDAADCGGSTPVPACDPQSFPGCDACLRTTCSFELNACTQASCMPELSCFQCCLAAQVEGGQTIDLFACAESCSVGGLPSDAVLDLLTCASDASGGCPQCIFRGGPVPIP